MSERLRHIEGTVNFRDLGGFTADGGTTRSDVLFRSDALHRLSDLGRDQLGELGVIRVIDLRDDTERGRAPDLLPETAALVAHPIFPDAHAHVSRSLDVISLTQLIYQQHGDTLAAAVAMIADGPGDDGAGTGTSVGTVIHCTAGKDRTGAVAALTLLAVGVHRDEVVADYASSERYLSGEWAEQHIEALRGMGMEVTPAVRQLIGGTPVAAIEQALAGIERGWGSARDYLLAQGFPESGFERLHARLVG